MLALLILSILQATDNIAVNVQHQHQQRRRTLRRRRSGGELPRKVRCGGGGKCMPPTHLPCNQLNTNNRTKDQTTLTISQPAINQIKMFCVCMLHVLHARLATPLFLIFITIGKTLLLLQNNVNVCTDLHDFSDLYLLLSIKYFCKTQIVSLFSFSSSELFSLAPPAPSDVFKRSA